MKKKSQLIVPFLCIHAMLMAQPFNKVNISNVSVINSTTLDFSPAFHKDGIVFVSNKEIEGKNKIYDKHINQKTMSLFIAKRNAQGNLQKPEPFALELVTSVHEGPLTFAKDFKTLYFSRNNNQKGGKAKYVEQVDRMQIYESHLTDKGWSKAKQLIFDREEKDFCHPTLSADGQKLYFSSNRKGGFGGMDLYVSQKQTNGEWGLPNNLGSAINSAGNEAFPFIHEDGTLYFSSNKEGGLGGLDVYYARPKMETFDTPLSIGTPFNSSKDDFGFILDKERKLGYFTSNRAGGYGEDDIYSFATADEITPNESAEYEITLVVLDDKTLKPVMNADILLGLNNWFSNQKIMTNDSGKTLLKLNRKHDYEVKVDKSTYNAEQIAIAKENTRREIIVLLNQPDADERNITLIVLDKNTRQPLSNAVVNWGQNNIYTNKKGKVILNLNRDEDYQIKVDKMKYNGNQIAFQKEDKREEIEVLLDNSNNTDVAFDTQNEVKTNSINEKPKTTTSDITQVDDVNRSDYPTKPKRNKNNDKINTVPEVENVAASNDFYQLNNIYYDFDKANIRSDASETLDSLIFVLNKFPDMEIELIAHTDSRGTNRYNDNLAQRRAINAEKYLLQNGISKSRIIHKSKGENELANDCGDGVPCDEMRHQLNRRTEVRVVKKGSSEGRVIEK
jgi:outer membrane protein OmpA-like peptidoglycan-associated protein